MSDIKTILKAIQYSVIPSYQMTFWEKIKIYMIAIAPFILLYIISLYPKPPLLIEADNILNGWALLHATFIIVFWDILFG